jgi:hypothetical protein
MLRTIVPSGNGVSVGVSEIVGVSDVDGVGETVRLGVGDAGSLVGVIVAVEVVFSLLLHPTVARMIVKTNTKIYFFQR